MDWSKLGRHLVADWKRGTAQIVCDSLNKERPFKFAVFETGALIAQGREPTLAAAKRAAEAGIPS